MALGAVGVLAADFLGLYVPPVIGVHEAGEMAWVSGGHGGEVSFFGQFEGLCGKDHVHVQPLLR